MSRGKGLDTQKSGSSQLKFVRSQDEAAALQGILPIVGEFTSVPTEIESTAPTSLEFANLHPRGSVHPSPENWDSQILYFLLPDRFSDGRESGRPMFDRNHPEQFRAQDKKAWMEAGRNFQGGTLKGVRSKLPY